MMLVGWWIAYLFRRNNGNSILLGHRDMLVFVFALVALHWHSKLCEELLISLENWISLRNLLCKTSKVCVKIWNAPWPWFSYYTVEPRCATPNRWNAVGYLLLVANESANESFCRSAKMKMEIKTEREAMFSSKGARRCKRYVYTFLVVMIRNWVVEFGVRSLGAWEDEPAEDAIWGDLIIRHSTRFCLWIFWWYGRCWEYRNVVCQKRKWLWFLFFFLRRWNVVPEVHVSCKGEVERVVRRKAANDLSRMRVKKVEVIDSEEELKNC